MTVKELIKKLEEIEDKTLEVQCAGISIDEVQIQELTVSLW